MCEYRYIFSNGDNKIVKTACTEKTAKFLLMCTNRNEYKSFMLVDKKPVIKRKSNLTK